MLLSIVINELTSTFILWFIPYNLELFACSACWTYGTLTARSVQPHWARSHTHRWFLCWDQIWQHCLKTIMSHQRCQITIFAGRLPWICKTNSAASRSSWDQFSILLRKPRGDWSCSRRYECPLGRSSTENAEKVIFYLLLCSFSSHYLQKHVS